MGDGDGGGPGEVREGGPRLILLGGADQEGQTAGRGQQGGGGGEDGFEVFDSAEGDYVVGGG